MPTKIRILKNRPDGTWISQCVLIEGTPFNITGWHDISRSQWGAGNPSSLPYAAVLRRDPKKAIPRNAIRLRNFDAITLQNENWTVHSKLSGKIRFAWLIKTE